MARPNPTDFPDFFNGYISEVPEDELSEAFANQLPVVRLLLSSVTEQESLYAYAPGKWTIKEMMQHIIDTERIFAYRAVCIARKEKISLPSFDENEYANNADANRRNWLDLCNEFMNARRSTQDLFESFTYEMLQQSGTSNNRKISVLSLGFIIVGHLYHHIHILKDRYLSAL